MIGKKSRLVRWHESNPIVFGLVLGLASVGFLTLLNVSLGMVPAFRALYILPIWIGTRLGGRLGGFIVVTFATLSNVWLDSTVTQNSGFQKSGGLTWFCVFSLVMLLVAQVESALSRSERLAHQDPLTGLFNRRGLETEGRRIVQGANKSQSTASVVMVDCDRFKGINDLYGHRAGDEVLLFLARTLKDNTRDTDVLARLGGDEFVLVLDDTGEEEAERVLSRVQEIFDAGMVERGFDASLSVGMAQISPETRDLRSLVAKADEAMYLRKERKRSHASHH
jgi:diguanylate cyclase (GGDEF)-like protein